MGENPGWRIRQRRASRFGVWILTFLWEETSRPFRVRFSRGSATLCAALMFSACALQATVVDLETDVDTLKKHQQALQQRLEVTEKAVREQPAPKNQSDLVSRIDGLTSDLHALSGKLEESGHQVAGLSQKIDDLSFRVQESLNRLEELEARLSTLEKTVEVGHEGTRGQAESVPGDRPVLPGRSLEGGLRRGSGGITPTEAYNLAYNDYLKGNYDLAIMGFQNFLRQFPTSSQVPHALYWLGEAYYGKKEYASSIDWFERVMREYPRSEKAASSQLKEGYAYLELGDRAQGRAALKRVVEQYPFTTEADLAKNRLAELK